MKKLPGIYPDETFPEQADRFVLAWHALKLAILQDIRGGLAWLRHWGLRHA